MEEMRKVMETRFNKLEHLVMRAFAAWCLAASSFVGIQRAYLYNITYVGKVDFVKVAGLFLFAFLLLTIANALLKVQSIDAIAMVATLVVYLLEALYMKNDVYLTMGFTAFLLFVLVYLMKRYRKQIYMFEVKSNKTVFLVIALVGAMWLIYMAGIGVIRYLSLKTPTFDFGIFSQMFYYMRDTLKPLTTCERDGLLSHFAVHVSPALYLLLPVYYIFPYQITLIILQAVIVASGIIPLYLLCKKKNLSKFLIIGITIIYFTYPASMGGLFYDFHENKMLLPLILWLFYFIEKNNNIGTIIFSLLTLMVKEDAAVYVACIGIYVMLCRKDLKKNVSKGLGMCAFSILYFGGVFIYLNKYGDGAMIGRYANYLANQDDGLIGMLLTIFKNPAYLFSQVFTAEKMEYVLWMLVPLLFIPLRRKKITEYVLLIPFLLIGLMSNNGYQHSIYYQYTYGATAIFMFMLVDYFTDIKPNKRIGDILYKKNTIILAVFASAIIGFSAITPKISYLEQYMENKESYNEIKEVLYSIPKDASVEASTMLVSTISNRKEIYREGTTHECEYVIYDLRSVGTRNDLIEKRNEKLANGYTEFKYIENVIVVLKKK